jgi:hypothetical protein
MDLPIKFPTVEDVVLDDVRRFRALSREEKIAAIRELLELGAFLKQQSSNPEGMQRAALHHANQKREAVKEFLARHAG